MIGRFEEKAVDLVVVAEAKVVVVVVVKVRVWLEFPIDICVYIE